MYHRIGKVRRDSIVPGQYVGAGQFRRQMRMLEMLGLRTITLDEMAKSFPSQSAVITFDDGYESFFDLALPVLTEKRQTATVFLVSSLLGGKNEWDLKKGDVEEKLMTAEQIAGALKQGIQFGSHSATHADLAASTPEQLAVEIAGSREVLAKTLGNAPGWFCYPYGSNNEAVREAVRAAGFVGACATGKGGNGAKTNPYAYRRINVRSDTFLPYFWLKLRKAMRQEVQEA